MQKADAGTRRNFLQTAGGAGIGAILAGFETPAAAAETLAKNLPNTVSTRPFGKSGIDVSILSLGGMFDIPSNQLLLKQALKWGVTYWDTAASYGGGKSEKGIGKYFTRFPDDRQKVFLVTKSHEHSPGGMTRLLRRSLERMNTDYIDLFFVHAISDINDIDESTRRWAEKAKAAGKIRLFGFSTHSNMENCLLGASRLGWIDGIMMSYNFRLMHSERMKAAVAHCAAAGIGLTAMKTQGGGSVRTDSDIEMQLAGRFLRKGFSDAQAKLKAVWKNSDIASICSQMPNLSLLMANTAAALDRTRLSAGDVELMRRYAVQTAGGYCSGCSHICESALPAPVPVGDVMRYLMYRRSYNDPARAASGLRRIPASTRRYMQQIDYAPAEERCPQGMAIGRLMKEALTELTSV